MSRITWLAASGFVLAAAFGSAAQAADAKQIADALVAAATASGDSKASYENATASGDDVTVTNFAVTGKDGDSFAIPSVVITGAQPRDKGGFTATRMTIDGGSAKSDDGTAFTWKTGALDEATVPSPDEIKAKAKIRPFSKVAIGGINVSDPNMAAPVDISEVAMQLATTDDGVPRDFTLNIAGMNLPGALFADSAQAKSVLDALGYDGFTLNIVADGGYDTATDVLTLRGFTIDTIDVGKLGIQGKFGGVPLSKLADNASDVGETGKLENLTIRFDNSGIVERALDMQAKMMGAKREDVVAQISGALPFMLNAIGNQPFQDKIASAAAAFLKDPKSITIAAQPATPVAFQQIMTTVGDAPQTLPDLLSVDVIANQ